MFGNRIPKWSRPENRAPSWANRRSWIDPEIGKKLQHLVGKRVRVEYCDDPYRDVNGKTGTVSFVDGTGTAFVDFDDGGSLGLVYGHDRYTVIE